MSTRHNDDLDRVLDRALDGIRSERPDPAFEQAAVDRVWQRLGHQADSQDLSKRQSQRIESCGDFQGLLPDYLGGRLSGPRLLLLEDHLGECVPCRRAMKNQQTAGGLRRVATQRSSQGWASKIGWRMAAAAAIFVALVGFSWKTDVFSFESGGLIRIEAVDGELFRMSDDAAVPLNAGDEVTLQDGEQLRTAKGSSAILALNDASRVEMRERSQLAVMERKHLFPGRKNDGRIDLDRGSIIVEASDQGSGHLFVDTNDCNVAVTGTVFAVSHGMKGSRVSVVEGEVHVDHPGGQDVLHPGDQANTRDALERVPVEHDIAWSRNSAEYVELLREMRALGRELDEMFQPELRYDTRLLDLAPAGTAVYFAMPNMSDELGQAYSILQDRVATSVVLKQWWEQNFQQSGETGDIERFIDRIRTFGEFLDEEIVMTVQLGVDGNDPRPLFLARVTDSGSFMQMLSDEIDALETEFDEDVREHLHLIEGPLSTLAPASENDGLYFWTQGDVLAMTPSYEMLWSVDAAIAGHDGATLAGGFRDRLSTMYADGVEWVVGVDLKRLIAADPTANEQLDQLGFLDAEYLIGERKHVDGRTDNRAELTFDQPRRSVASWIAEPAPMGALDYIGPDANLVGAFVMQDMSVVVEDLFEMISESEVDFEQALADFEREEGIDIRRDVAEPLGGEFAVALDGPILPTPSWKVIAEVYDPSRLQHTIGWLVEHVNGALVENGGRGLTLDSEMLGSREYFMLESLDTGFALHYVYDGGYLVAGPSRGLIDRTLQNRDSGIKLTDSAKFIDLLPRDEQVNFSGILYQNMSPILDPLSSTLETVGGVPDNQRRFVQALAAEAKPSLALLYGERDRVILASSSEGGLFTSMMDQLSGASSLLGMQQSLAQALHEGAGAR